MRCLLFVEGLKGWMNVVDVVECFDEEDPLRMAIP